LDEAGRAVVPEALAGFAGSRPEPAPGRRRLFVQEKECAMQWSRFALAGFLILGLALVGTAGTGNAKKIVATWRVAKTYKGGPPVGTLVAFAKNGTVKIRAKIEGKELTAEGTYKLEGKKLITNIKFGDESKEETHTIKSLTANELVVEDAKDQVVELKRVTKKKAD
jgi:uncharacterized protein (TIGR03066 family)